MTVTWRGVFPAASTQFNEDESLNLDATQRVFASLIKDGVDGLVIMGSVGENTALNLDEKRKLMAAAREAAGDTTVLTGIAEFTTANAIVTAKAAEEAKLDGLMLLPGMSYKSMEHEVVAHYGKVAEATSLPIMAYNNPMAYGVDITVETLKKLSPIENIVSIKESSGAANRFVDLKRELGDRYILFCGLDDVLLESMLLGAVGWVSGMCNVFPAESVALFKLAEAGRWNEARKIYEWFMPLLHLDAVPTFVQNIKLAEQVAGRGSEMVRAPRLKLEGRQRAAVIQAVETALATRPDIDL